MRSVSACLRIAAFSLLFGSPAGAAIHPRLASQLAGLPRGATLPVWVVFADKGVHEAEKTAPRRDLVSARSLERRRKVRAESALLDAGDLPLDELYVRAVAATGAHIRQRSKWLNRLSVDVTREQAQRIAALPCVRAVDPLVRWHRDPRMQPERGDAAPPSVAPKQRSGARGSSLLLDPSDYGPSFKQLQQIGITTLHAQGITGENVLVGHFDNGYRLLAHDALAGVAIVATHDFIDGDTDPAPPPGSPTNWGAHGILTLSALAGFAPGHLIGAAYGASFVLARTENDASETPLEEDNWVAAIEWADSLGIDVASTSLGYLSYDEPFPDWTWQNMDGATTAITRAADLAAGRGIVVVNSAGNNGFDPSHNTLLAPADGDSVIAVGAVDSLDVRASFSSVGPTTDVPARFKPDVATRGILVHCASSSVPNGYRTASGTSLACPLAAGAAALLVGARPAATPMQIRDALRLTASQASSPDNLLGWGVVNAAAALAWLNSSSVQDRTPFRAVRLAVVPNPFNPVTTVRWELPSPALVTLAITDARGRLVRTLHRGTASAGEHGLVWDGRDDGGHALPSGVYFIRLDSPGATTLSSRTKAVLVR